MVSSLEKELAFNVGLVSNESLAAKVSLFFFICGQRPPYIIVPHTIFNTL